MTDTKTALYELNAMRMRLKAIDGTYDWEDSYKAIEAALTTTPAPTVMMNGEMDNNGPIVPCSTCNSDPETCADVPDARRVYGFHNGKALSCHPPGVESAIETFLRFNGAVFVDGKPVEKFGIATGAMSSAIQAYLDYYRNGVGDTDETRKSY